MRLWMHSAFSFIFINFNFSFVGHVSSAAEVPVSPVSESQNRLLSNNQHANNIGDHLADNDIKSGELYQRR